MNNGVMKNLISELTRGGCRLETLAYDPPAITFRSPAGARCSIRADRGSFRLDRLIDLTLGKVPAASSFFTMREAVRAAVTA